VTTADFVSPTRDDLAASGALRAPQLHPTTQDLVRQFSRYGGLSDRVSVPFARRQMRKAIGMLATSPTVASVVDRTVSAPAGPVPVRVVTPHTGVEPRPALIWYPGGGFVLGDLATAEPTARSLANRIGAVVVCVDYRKAPEHLVDDAYNDSLAVVRWMFNNADGLGVDDTRIGVAGDSAGGNIAAVVAQEYTASADERQLAVQLLVYPSVSGQEPARAKNADGGGTLDDRALRWFEMHVAGAMDPDSLRYSPLATPELGDLPPAVIVTAGWDPLRDEAIAYLDRLRAAGVRAEHFHYPDEVHGFFTMDLVLDNARDAMDAVTDAVADIFGLATERQGVRPLRPADRFRTQFEARLRRVQSSVDYWSERMGHVQRGWQRSMIRSMGLPAGSDVETLNSHIKRLENQMRTLRRQLDRETAAREIASSRSVPPSP
jgi:acetyl esterase